MWLLQRIPTYCQSKSCTVLHTIGGLLGKQPYRISTDQMNEVDLSQV